MGSSPSQTGITARYSTHQSDWRSAALDLTQLTNLFRNSYRVANMSRSKKCVEREVRGMLP